MVSTPYDRVERKGGDIIAPGTPLCGCADSPWRRVKAMTSKMLKGGHPRKGIF